MENSAFCQCWGKMLYIYTHICQSPILVCPGSFVLYFQSMTCKPLSHLDPGFLLYPLTHHPKNQTSSTLGRLGTDMSRFQTPKEFVCHWIGIMFGQKSSMDANGSHWIGIVPGKKNIENASTFRMTSTGLLGVCFVLCVFNFLTLFFIVVGKHHCE